MDEYREEGGEATCSEEVGVDPVPTHSVTVYLCSGKRRAPDACVLSETSCRYLSLVHSPFIRQIDLR